MTSPHCRDSPDGTGRTDYHVNWTGETEERGGRPAFPQRVPGLRLVLLVLLRLGLHAWDCQTSSVHVQFTWSPLGYFDELKSFANYLALDDQQAGPRSVSFSAARRHPTRRRCSRGGGLLRDDGCLAQRGLSQRGASPLVLDGRMFGPHVSVQRAMLCRS